MSKPSCLLAALAILVLAASGSGAAVAVPEITEPHLDTYVTSDGTPYFALSVAPNIALPPTAAHNVVILFDTSASQASVFRDRALATLTTLIATLPRGDRVRLMAVDLEAVPMSSGFVGPQSDEMNRAVAALKRRVPLGATDMPAVLQAAAASFGEAAAPAGHGAANAKALVYIGDGMSKANFLTTPEYRKLLGTLVDQRVPITSFAVGPRVDAQLLASLANQTGGMLAVDGESLDPKEAGLFLASAVRGTVLWPGAVTWPKQFAEVYPSRMPPLRSDRDTIVVGKVVGDLTSEVRIAITAQLGGKPQGLHWTLAVEDSNEAFAFLPALVESAHDDGGLRLVTLGTPGLNETRRMLDESVQLLAKLGSQAVAAGNLETAERLADEALRRDSTDSAALAVKKQLAKIRAGEPVSIGPQEKLEIKRFSSEQAAPPKQAAGVKFRKPSNVEAVETPEVHDDVINDGEGRLLADIDRQNQLISNQIRAEVDNELRESRARMASNPISVEQDLKLTLERVSQAPELKAEVRAQLRGQLETMLREANRRAATKDIIDRQIEEARAGALDRLRIADGLARTQEKVKQLTDRFNSLMDEGRYTAADQIGSMELPAIAPDLPISASTALVAHATGARVANLALRNARSKAVVDTLNTVEVAMIPFPDDQPVVFPDAAQWEELTLRRLKYRSVDLKKFTPAEQKIREALGKPTSIEFVEEPLQDVVNDLKDLHDIEIQLDDKALDDAGILRDTAITLPRIKGISFRSVLGLLRKKYGLHYLIQDDMLLVTSKDVAEAEENLVRKVYPVGDLVVPIQSGGMGMGGMFSVPDAPAPRARSFQAFAVQDDLKLVPKKTPTGKGADSATSKPTDPQRSKAAAPTKTAAPAKSGGQPAAAADKPVKRVAPIQLTIAADADPDVAWNDYFASHPDVKPPVVRETARQLMHEQKFTQLISMVRAALGTGQPQPWMYEALGLAMQASGSPKADIERALMSAIDFGDSTEDFMYVAQYMARSGLESRALKIFHQVTVLEPLRPEPYLYGLQLAQRLNDLEGIRWSSLGILKQEWPRDKNSVVQSASRAAAAVVAQLKAEKRSSEAAEFQAQLDIASVRDCKVKVTWTGDADVDVLVEEPSGTVCSFRNPRSTGGGVLLGDSALPESRNSAQGLSETYVCPEAFNGTYRVTIRRVWGKVTAGKVTVDVYSHYGTSEQKHLRDQIPVGDADSLVVFDIQDGRRKEPLAEQQLANAAAGQIAVNQAILAQQLNSLAGAQSGGAGNNFGLSRQGLLGIPFIRQAVGYQPVIQQIPSGARLSVSGVISADRRYVRISPQPSFTQIGQVTTFNLQQGVTGTQNGGQQGGGGVGGGNPQGGGGGIGGGGGVGGGGPA